MQKISGKVLILGVVGVLIVVGLGYVMITKFGLLGANHNTTQDLTPTINSYPFHQFDEIQLPQSIPVYPESILVEKLEGKNEFNQDLRMFKFRTAGKTDIADIYQYYITEFPKNNWQITSQEYKKCDINNTPCYDWLQITATQSGETAEVISNISAGISIALSSGKQHQVTLRPPEDFPALLIPTSFQITQFVNGFDEGKRKISFVKLQNITETMLNDLMPVLLKDSWEKETTCGTLGGQFYCLGFKNKSRFDYDIYTSQFFGRDETTLRLTEKVVDNTLTDLQNGWMRYTNNQYGLSFEVPDFWDLERIDKNLQGSRQDLYLNRKDISCSSNTKCGKFVFLFVSNTSNIGESIDIWYTKLETENGFGSGEVLEKEKTDIAGKKAWKLKVGYEPGIISPVYLIFNFEKGYVFGLDMSFEPLTDTEKDITQHILNTLHFDN